MDFISGILAPVQWTSGFWESIIKLFSGVGNIGVAIILLTLCLKVVLLPLDFWQKMVSRKMTAQQAIMQPELDEIKLKYGNNRVLMQQKQSELYKKYNMNPGNSCLAMLVYLVVTMIVFFTLFAGLGNISRTQINYEYYTIQQAYVQTYEENKTNPDVVSISQVAAADKYEEIKQSFLTIKNIWRPDNASSVFPHSEDFLRSTGTKFGVYKYEPANVSYIYLTTNGQEYEDANGKKYVEPYVDLNGNVYVVCYLSDSFTINAIDGDLTYNNLVYSTIIQTYENTDLNITYFVLTSNNDQKYTKDEKTYVKPYANKENKIFAVAGSETEVVIDGVTYTVDYSKTEAEVLQDYITDNDLNIEKQQKIHETNAGYLAIEAFTQDYDLITTVIHERYNGQWNGFLILVALAGAITFLSSYLANAGVRTKDQKGNKVKAARPKPTMGIIMSIVMIFFTFSYTSAFAIYIVTNSVLSMLFAYLSNLVLNKIEIKKENRDNKVADYVRK
ncbi:MAG TPA: hypothetical protein DCO89_02090 [Clostridiales bacterium]|nr:hypothetical protein [Clostridiales bacterium]